MFAIGLLKRPLLYLFILCHFFSKAQARKRSFVQNELVFWGGASYYIGDLNPRGHFLFSKPATGIYFRRSNHYRYAFRFGLSYGQIYGDDSKSKEADQKERNLSFKSNLYEFSSIAEFNFVDYRIGNENENFTVFIFAGLAGFYFNPKADLGNGYQSLAQFKTEGQSKSYNKFQMSVPFGIGLKFNAGDKLGFGIEWGPRKTFTDFLDDVSGAYPSNLSSSETKKNFTDRTTNGSASPGAMRGNPSTRDWYFYYGITMNYKLPSTRGSVCHGSGKQRSSRRSFLKKFHLRNNKSIFK